jgi:hypothetical protein
VKNNRLIIALVVLVGVGALAMNAARSRQSATTLEKPAEKLPTIKKDEVTTVEIVKPDKQTITLTKQDGTWQVTAPVTAKADTSSVDAVLEKLESLEVGGVAATRKENHARLQVDADKAIRVKAKNGEKTLADLYIGASKGGSTMVRAEGSDTVLSIRGSIRYAFDKEVKMFRDRVITDIDSDALTAVSFESPKGKFRFDKAEKTWKQAAGDKPIKDFADSKVQSAVSTLARLRAADFAEPTLDAAQAGLTPPAAKVTLTSKDKEPVVLELGAEVSNERYLRRSGSDVIYRVSKFNGERMLADAAAFAIDPKEAAKAANEPPAMPPGMEGMGGPGGPGGMNQLPPELMQQLQQQMAKQPH